MAAVHDSVCIAVDNCVLKNVLCSSPALMNTWRQQFSCPGKETQQKHFFKILRDVTNYRTEDAPIAEKFFVNLFCWFWF